MLALALEVAQAAVAAPAMAPPAALLLRRLARARLPSEAALLAHLSPPTPTALHPLPQHPLRLLAVPSQSCRHLLWHSFCAAPASPVAARTPRACSESRYAAAAPFGRHCNVCMSAVCCAHCCALANCQSNMCCHGARPSMHRGDVQLRARRRARRRCGPPARHSRSPTRRPSPRLAPTAFPRRAPFCSRRRSTRYV